MINHKACEQLILFNNNLKMMSMEQAKEVLQNVYTGFNVVAKIANSFWKGPDLVYLEEIVFTIRIRKF